MPTFIREQEAEGKLVLLGERKGRYLAYIHDPNAETDELTYRAPLELFQYRDGRLIAKTAPDMRPAPSQP